jgi:hypothetical protein
MSQKISTGKGPNHKYIILAWAVVVSPILFLPLEGTVLDVVPFFLHVPFLSQLHDLSQGKHHSIGYVLICIG